MNQKKIQCKVEKYKGKTMDTLTNVIKGNIGMSFKEPWITDDNRSRGWPFAITFSC